MPRHQSLTRRLFIASTLAASLLSFGNIATAQTAFPDRPVRLIVTTAPGAAIDTTTRLIAEGLAQKWGQPVIVENKPGAAGAIAAQYVAGQSPDGYVVLITTNSGHILNPLVKKQAGFDPDKDFVAVGSLAEGQYAFVADRNAPYNNLKELIEWTKQQPNGLAFGTPGQGTAMHLFGDYLAALSGASLVHVPYNTNVEVTTMGDMADGSLGAAFWTNAGAYNHRNAGRIKILAMSGNERNERLADVPTFAEQGFQNFDVVPWIGAVVRSGTPTTAIAALSDGFNDVLQQPKIAQTLQNIGFKTRLDTPANFQLRLQTEKQRWQDIIKATGFTPN